MKALLVIDMLNDFVEKGGALDCGDRAREIVPFVRRKIEEFRREKQRIVSPWVGWKRSMGRKSSEPRGG